MAIEPLARGLPAWVTAPYQGRPVSRQLPVNQGARGGRGMPLAMLLSAALACSACSKAEGTGITKIRVIGEVAEPLELRGSASFITGRESVFCRMTSLVSGSFHMPKEQRFEAKFQRLDGRRYELVFDLQQAPSGGFCRWALAGFTVLAKLPRVTNNESTVLGLHPVHWEAKLRRGGASQVPRTARLDFVQEAICTKSDRLLQCTGSGSTFQAFAGEGTFHLNVSWVENGSQE